MLAEMLFLKKMGSEIGKVRVSMFRILLFPLGFLLIKKDIKATLNKKKKTVKYSYLSPLLSPL